VYQYNTWLIQSFSTVLRRLQPRHQGVVALPRPRYTPGQDAYCYEYEGNVVTWYTAVGFDPAVSSHFYVFQMVVVDYTTECYLEAVEIYSSETGAWIMSEMGRGDAYFGAFMHHMTYFNGSLHLTRDSDAVASVGAKGRSWRITHVLRREEDHIITMGVHT
jgi:hypothetical protein